MFDTFKRLLHEFLKDSSIHGLRLLLLSVQFRYAKKLWIIFMTLIIIYTHYIIYNLTAEYLQSPTEIHMSTNQVHVANSPFVSVGVCSPNKISRRKLKIFAEKVYEDQQKYHPGYLAATAPEMEDFLLLLIGFYVYPHDDYDSDDWRLKKLHEILMFMYGAFDYPSREILRDLAPDCEDIVLRSMIFGKILNNSEQFLFSKRMTSTGVCCMFNYKRESYSLNEQIRQHHNKKRLEEIKFEANSILNSVQFVLQDSPEDFRFKDLANNAFQVLLLPNEDYPTLQSNSVGEVLIAYNSIVEVPVQPTFKGSSYSIHQFKPHLRKCYYPDEGQKLLNRSYYSADECLLICRMRSMVNHCGCVNPSMPADIVNATYCNLLDLPCLTQWKRIWYGWNFFDYVTNNEEKLQRSYKNAAEDTTQRCDLCYPTCDVVDFKIYLNVSPLVKAYGKTYKLGLLANISNTKPLAIIKLFFKQRYALATEEDITGDWVVLINRFGGIMSLMYGFSIMSYIEIVYYLTGKWFKHVYKALKGSKKLRYSRVSGLVIEKNISNQKKSISLYWHELKPKSVTPKKFENAEILHGVRKN